MAGYALVFSGKTVLFFNTESITLQLVAEKLNFTKEMVTGIEKEMKG